MNEGTTVLGLDVHKDTITVATLLPGRDTVPDTQTFPNTPEAIRQLVKRLQPRRPLAAVYEAGGCGYDVYRQLTKLEVACAVVAPALTPVRPGDRVKTDGRDAIKLARLYRAGELAIIAVPTPSHEAARDLVRTREDMLGDRVRARHRVTTFLLRHGFPWRRKAWGTIHRNWLATLHFELLAQQETYLAYLRGVEEVDARLESVNVALQRVATEAPWSELVAALRCLKGVDTLGALTLAVEAQSFQRFPTARAFMAYTGLVPSEHSSGAHGYRGGITKTGNAHLRRILVECAWCNRYPSGANAAVLARRKGCSPAVVQVARKAQVRLRRTYARLIQRGKPHPVATVAVARELAGFVWAIGRLVVIPA
jgi:transposase